MLTQRTTAALTTQVKVFLLSGKEGGYVRLHAKLDGKLEHGLLREEMREEIHEDLRKEIDKCKTANLRVKRLREELHEEIDKCKTGLRNSIPWLEALFKMRACGLGLEFLYERALEL